MLVGKDRDLPQCGAPESGFTQLALALLVNIGLGWNGLPGTNILAFYENP